MKRVAHNNKPTRKAVQKAVQETIPHITEEEYLKPIVQEAKEKNEVTDNIAREWFNTTYPNRHRTIRNRDEILHFLNKIPVWNSLYGPISLTIDSQEVYTFGIELITGYEHYQHRYPYEKILASSSREEFVDFLATNGHFSTLSYYKTGEDPVPYIRRLAWKNVLHVDENKANMYRYVHNGVCYMTLDDWDINNPKYFINEAALPSLCELYNEHYECVKAEDYILSVPYSITIEYE